MCCLPRQSAQVNGEGYEAYTIRTGWTEGTTIVICISMNLAILPPSLYITTFPPSLTRSRKPYCMCDLTESLHHDHHNIGNLTPGCIECQCICSENLATHARKKQTQIEQVKLSPYRLVDAHMQVDLMCPTAVRENVFLNCKQGEVWWR